MKRTVLLEGIGTELELARVTSVDIDKKVIYFEEMPDGRWRLTYTKSLIPDLKQLVSLKIIRED